MSATALIIGESPTARERIAIALEETTLFGKKLFCTDLKKAARWLSEYPVDMICCDPTGVEESFGERLAELHRRENWRDIPVVLFQCSKGIEDRLASMEEGAADCLSPEVSLRELTVRLHRHLKVRERLKELHLTQVRLARLALTDSLTGVFNRAFFDATLDQEVSRSLRSKRPLSLLLVDLDHFKKINDTYGHAVGDEVLRMVGALLGRQVRKSDTICRYGGEEFAIILPETTQVNAQRLAERVRRAIAAHPSEYAVTASVGVSCSTSLDYLDPLVLLDAADKALYAAKDAGRNRCVMADRILVEPIFPIAFRAAAMV